jgi:thymidylate synthase
MKTSTIPVLVVYARTLPEGWEKSVLECWHQGAEIKTEYDKPGDPASRDCTMVINVAEPFAEPRIHRAFPAGLEDLEIYRQEVVLGVHDHWIKPEEGKWQYTYHERLFNYKVEGKSIDQIQYVIDKLAQAPHTRRAQAVTWKAWEDIGIHDPACLQRLWFRILDNKLYLNCHMRSNDAYKAAYMNMFAFTDLQRIIAEKVSKKTGRTIQVGTYTHIADSFHIYGSYFKEFENFLKSVKERSFEERVWDSSFAEEYFAEGRKRLEEEKSGK